VLTIIFMYWRVLVALAALLSTGALSSCGGDAATAEPGTSVVAGFYPFAFVAERVAGGHASVQNLTPPGVEPHDLELAPQQVASVAAADVVVYERGFQPALDEAVTENGSGAIVEVTQTLAASRAQGGPALSADPHIWHDPTKLVPIASAVAKRLAEADPAHARQYRSNAAALVQDLQALDQDLARGLAQCQRRTFVTSHAAFGHLAHRYGLHMVPIAGLDPEAEPSPERLARLKHLAQARDLTTIFTETLVSPDLARTLADEVGVRTGVLDPIEGLTRPGTGEDYFSLMRANLAVLRKANNCT
jgi:zinc transport system substrate-binding protein